MMERSDFSEYQDDNF